MSLFQSHLSTLVDLLPQPVVARLHAAGRTKDYTAGALIQSRGDTHRGLSVLLSGRIVAGNVGSDGSFVVTSILQPGECFGEFTLFADLPRTHDLSAATDCSVLQLTEQAFTLIFDEEPVIARALLSITLRRTHDLLEFLDGQRRLALPVRLARVLLSLHNAEYPHEPIVCKQEELAYLMGVTRVSVSKALKGLVGEGLLRLGYGAITINDIDAMNCWVETRSLVTPVAAPRMTLESAK